MHGRNTAATAWLSLTPEPERTLPHLLALLEASQRPADAPDARSARIVVRDLPVSAGALHIVATLLAAGDARQPLDRYEAVARVEPASLEQRGLLVLRHDWEWQEQHTPVPTEARSGSLFRR